ncbi:aspartate/glutamate racemase family protein [Ramlibacter sp.]|uniref:aspartate/glutamate racemase family protein n=1 Tax=Ramlibacter sp. TaxID=1917967 RepID=UPI0017B32BA0|nr:aspartate/glutamate racemase family protein [Ramlibacter sp.]MBA2675173.1 aspartate/glutamate racemase family protein [Ramlibacter sp.]
MTSATGVAKIGILCWEKGQVPRGLMQLETLVGNSTNPASYDYPVHFVPVHGANVHTILENPDPAVLRTMIADARTMAAQGVKAITTSCGFNAIFQQELAEAVGVPVFTSSLLLVPLVQQIHGPKSEICVLTANTQALRPEHLSSVGISRTEGLHIIGLEQCSEWNRIFAQPDAEVDLAVIEQEILGTVLRALETYPGIRAFVLECTDLPPYAAMIRRRSGLPVFDFISMINLLHSSL